MTAGGEPARVRAILELVRPHVDEIVLAADARRAEAILGACADLVDRPLRYAFEPPPARYIGWIHHQCTADWILRLDDDEVPGTKLLAALPRLTADRRPVAFALPRRHLHGAPDRYLASHPWAPDHQLRLVQNLPGVWSFAGTVHHAAEVLGERRRTTEPIYHLNYLLVPHAERRRRAERFEALSPGAMTEAYPVNALYLPEEWDGVQTAPVPAADLAPIAHVLEPAPAPPPAPTAPLPPVTPVREVDRFNSTRTPGPEAYRAELELVSDRRRLFAGTTAYLEVLARNRGDEHWPAAHECAPAIRLAYRWLDEAGDPVVAEGVRTAFEERVEPGAETRVMATVLAPEEPGRYVLELDLVHEFVRWFGSPVRATIGVEALAAPSGAPDDLGPPLARPRPAALIRPFGLDGLDLRLVALLPDGPGTFVEAGAHDGLTQSNTVLLERTRGWRGLLIEPIPEQAERCRANRPEAAVEQCALVGDARRGATVRMRYGGLMSLVEGAMGAPEADAAHVADGLERQGLASTYEVDVPARTLSSVLDAHGFEDVDLLVLDVEGAEADALRGLDLTRHRPAHLLVEARFRDDVEAVLDGAYEAVAELSHHDVLYARRGPWSPPRRLRDLARRLLS
jgi:FkbM family methyltransferase